MRAAPAAARVDPHAGGASDCGRALAWVLRLWILLALGIVLADMADSAKLSWLQPGRSVPPPPDRLGKEGPAVPMPLQPAGPGDQLRPYDPKIFPMRPDGGTPQLPGAAAALRRFDLQHDEQAEVLVLLSPGGAVQEALIMGEYIRARSIETLVPGGAYCALACPLLLAAGERRRVARDAWIGLHQPSFAKAAGLSPDVAVAEVQRLNYQILTRLDRWGVDPRVWTHALQALPAEMYVLLPEELMAYRMAHSLF